MLGTVLGVGDTAYACIGLTFSGVCVCVCVCVCVWTVGKRIYSPVLYR